MKNWLTFTALFLLTLAGVALENFDAIGSWRTEYGKGLPINPAGKLLTGEAFATPAQFHKLMVDQHEAFTRCLTEKLLTYATGRELIPHDRPHIDNIIREMNQPNKGLRDLVQLVVLCEVFRSN